MMPKYEVKYYDRSGLEAAWPTWQLRQWVGYICLSDRPLKDIYLTASNLPDWNHVNGDQYFIWEAHLYEQDKTSLMIKQINGQWLIAEITWTSDPANASGEYLDHVYIIRAQEELKAKFREAWMPGKDEQCEGMEVLKPAWRAFVGFEK